ncbi:MAG: protein kinase domain-containing protein [Armatimonadota bacterium]
MGVITIRCTHCGTSWNVDEIFGRKSVKCPRCRLTFTAKPESSAWNHLQGQVIEGKYTLREMLGEGGFALVFRADEMVSGVTARSVAVKLIFPDEDLPRQAQAEELTNILNLTHPCIVRGVSAGICDLGGLTWLYLVMELADETLDMRMHRGRLSLREAWEVTEHTASALAYLHKDPDRLVHRDLKPANILRVGDQWKLADFGLAYGMERTNHPGKRRGGTEKYIPPEGYEDHVTPAWDMWSFGVMMAEALTGRHPFEGDRALLFTITHLPPNLPEDLPTPFNEIINGCLIKKRNMRWTAPQVLAALEAARGMRATFSAARWTLKQALGGSGKRVGKR